MSAEFQGESFVIVLPVPTGENGEETPDGGGGSDLVPRKLFKLSTLALLEPQCPPRYGGHTTAQHTPTEAGSSAKQSPGLRLRDDIPDHGVPVFWRQAGIAMVLRELDAQPDVPDVPDVRGALAAFALNNMVQGRDARRA